MVQLGGGLHSLAAVLTSGLPPSDLFPNDVILNKLVYPFKPQFPQLDNV